jgi:N6-adenosine-specific RNA methylase IME4
MYKTRCTECQKLFAASRKGAITCSERCRVARHRRLHAVTPPWPKGGSFDLWMVDLPLRFTGRSLKGEGRSPQRHYSTMDIAALIAMRPMIDAVAAKHATFCFWVYGPRIPDLLKVIEGWRLVFKGELFCWEKISKTGGDRIGGGLSTRKQVENAWYATRGNGLARLDKGVSQLIRAPRGIHSEKPDEAYDRLLRLYGGTHRLDLFGRKSRPGWVSWGNEAVGVE